MLNMVFQRLERQSQDQVRRKTVAQDVLSDIISRVTGEEVRDEEPVSDAEARATSPVASVSSPSQTQSRDEEDDAGDAVVYNDSLIIFRALCKLADKELSDNVQETSLDARSKMLALELLQSILAKSGPAFRQNEKFINQAIKKWLVRLLLPNGFSPMHRVFSLSLDIFSQLALNFRESLKGEIGVFFKEVLLRLLETPNSSEKQKLAVVETLQTICTNPQTLVDIFLNYDCDLESKDIFEKMVLDLSTIAKGSTGQLREVALKCCVTIMNSLAQWSEVTADDVALPPVTATDEELEGVLSRTDSSNNMQGANNSNNNASSDEFSQVKQRKKAVEDAKKLFSSKPKKGMELMLKQGMLPDPSPEGIARWFHETQGLSLSAMGDYMGEDDPHCIAVMHAYTDQMSFCGLSIDMALRKFMSGFRLPGEGQKIDRFMEKFAAKYVRDNPQTVFANAEAAFMVAYSVIMLTTDLHRSKKSTQTPETFASMLRGLNDGANFPAEFTLGIYQNIAKNPITVQDVDLMNERATGTLGDREKAELFRTETSIAVKRSVAMLQMASSAPGRFVVGENHQLVRPMFLRCWAPMLAAFSLLLERCQEPVITSLCLEGFRSSIRVSAIFELENERNTFLNALLSFTLLQSRRLMQSKHVAAIKVLLELAEHDGNLLREGWMQVLKCISQLDKLRSMKLEQHGKEVNTTGNPSNSAPAEQTAEDDNWDRIAAEIPSDQIDQIFPRSASLDAQAIVHFIKCLVAVSQSEIQQTPPSMYALSKMVEVAAHNMARVRLVWASIWRVMADHFTRVGCGKDRQMAHFAVNALKQLAYQFLDKKELGDFNFQKEFLAPFKYIMTHSPDLTTRDLVLMCLNNAVELRAPKLQSGWKVMFLCLSEAAKDSNRPLVESGLTVLNGIREKHFVHVREKFFVELVSCYANFAESRFTDVCLQSIGRISELSNHLCGDGSVPGIPVRCQDVVFYTDSEEHIRLWWPILFNLSSLSSHAHVDVRTAALDSLFKILNECGGSFSPTLWTIVFSGVLRPIFDNARQHTVLSAADNEWLSSTCLKAFQYLVTLFKTFFGRLSFLLPDYLELLCGCILVDGNETLAQYGSTCLLTLVLENKDTWKAADLTSICRAILHLFKASCAVLIQPQRLESVFTESKQTGAVSADDRELLKRLEREGANGEEAPAEVRALKVSVLIMLTRVVSNLVDGIFERLAGEDVTLLLDALSYAYASVRRCSIANEKLRIRAELDSVSRILELLNKQQPPDLSRVARVMCDLLQELKGLPDGLRRQALAPTAQTLLQDLAKWDKARVARFGQEVFPILTALILDHDVAVRTDVSAAISHFWQLK